MLKKFKGMFLSRTVGIQGKIFAAFILVTIFALAVDTLVWYVNSSKIILNNATNYASDNIRRANDNLELILRDMDNYSAAIALDQTYVKDYILNSGDKSQYDQLQLQRGLSNYIETFYTYRAYIRAITIAGVNGQNMFSGTPEFFQNIMGQSWSKKILGLRGRSIFIKHYPEEYDILRQGNNISTLTIGRAVMDGENPIGIVLLDINDDLIEKTFDIKALQNSYIFVMQNDGNLIYSSDSTVKAKNAKDTYLSSIYGTVINDANYTAVQKLKGKGYLVVTYKSDYTGWTTVGIIQESTLTDDFMRLRNNTMWVVVLVCMMVLIVSILISSQITKNLKKLRNSMKSVEEGNLEINPYIDSRDEVGELSEGFVSMLQKIRSLMQELRIRERQKRSVELKALQAQISPHFLYNTLNTIRYLAQLQNVHNVEEVTTSLIELLRISIGSGEQFISVRAEIDHVKNYLNIQKYKYADSFSVTFNIEDEIMEYKTLKLILQPMVENALIHGLEPCRQNGLISIKAYRDVTSVKLLVTDNGVGMTEEEIGIALKSRSNVDRLRFSSIGISNVDERIKLHFGDKYGVRIFSQPDLYTTIEISIPLITEGEDTYDTSTDC